MLKKQYTEQLYIIIIGEFHLRESVILKPEVISPVLAHILRFTAKWRTMKLHIPEVAYPPKDDIKIL